MEIGRRSSTYYIHVVTDPPLSKKSKKIHSIDLVIGEWANISDGPVY